MKPLALTALLLTSGCVVVRLLPPTAEQLARVQAHWPEVTPASLEAGRVLYGDRCSGCHMLPDPHQRSAETWPPQIERMTSPSHLSPQQAELITRYLQAVAAP